MNLTTSEAEVFEVFSSGAEDAEKAVLILHDWWGVLEYNHAWAARFAEQGYRALVVDLYDGHHPENIKAAGEFMRSIDQEAALRKLRAALELLRAHHAKTAVLGWSFGGLQAQHAALKLPGLVDAIAFFYCRIIINRHNIEQLNVPVLAIFAEAESTWPDKQADLEQIMAEYDKDLECLSYDAAHGFANPDSIHYDSEACENAWEECLNFFERKLAR